MESDAKDSDHDLEYMDEDDINLDDESESFENSEDG